MNALIKQRALELGFDDCRITTAVPPESAAQFEQWLAARRHGEMAYLERNAAKRIAPQQVLPGARSIVSLAISYGAPQRDSITGPETIQNTTKGVIARYARHTDYHTVIGNQLKSLTAFLASLGGPDSRSLWYIDTGPVLERDIAQRAGLGFIGKHTNLISRKLGNWIFLAEILTTLEIEPESPEHNHCGTCSRCLAACPTAAITPPFQLDARRCISYLTIELKGAMPIELRPL